METETCINCGSLPVTVETPKGGKFVTVCGNQNCDIILRAKTHEDSNELAVLEWNRIMISLKREILRRLQKSN